MSLLLTVFLIAFVTQLITWIGKSVLVEWVYKLYLQLTRNPLAARQRELKTEILNNKTELLKTSAQDQFARWAKLRRSVDKGLAELEKLNSEISSSKSSFSTKFNTLIWVLTSGVQLVVGWWYGRQAVFYLPEGWMGPLTWWFSFPFAPRGSVSVGVWSFACKRVLLILERIVKAALSEVQTGSKEKVPVEATPVSASTRSPSPSSNEKSSTKEKPLRKRTTVADADED
ncbi:CHD5-like protein-domain-containing protein [Coprinopsis sp. MPI-PUGE-AT-0042]|nr:CHD5-like protein-domain-containing protein [Coprinopsis sp. MPI-PUGE-AT-0042]